jgi:hypothetical protein
MRKVKEVLACGSVSDCTRVRSPAVVPSVKVKRPYTVICRKLPAAGLTWPLPEDVDDRRLEELLFPAAAGRPSAATRSLPNFAVG